VRRARSSGCIEDLRLVEHALAEGSTEESRRVEIDAAIKNGGELILEIEQFPTRGMDLLELNQEGQARGEWANLSLDVRPEQWPEEVRNLADLVSALLGEKAGGDTLEFRAYRAAAGGTVSPLEDLDPHGPSDTPVHHSRPAHAS